MRRLPNASMPMTQPSVRSTRVRRALHAAVGGAILAATAVVAASCDRTVSPTENLPPLEAASIDADAGAWGFFVLTGPEQIAVPAPAAVTSEAYMAELIEKVAAGTN